MKKEITWLVKEKYNLPLDSFNKEIQKDIARLKKGEPIDYVIGFSDFLGCKIDLTFKPFIPRPETEFWTEKAIKEIKKSKSLCLDLFSGSGCIGIAVLKNNSNSKVDFAEKNKNFLKQIKLNLKINKIDKKRYNVFYSDIFQNVRKKYDYIFANPPYISLDRIKNVQNSVFDFEPKQALFAENQGLEYIEKFLKQANNYLKKQGKIYLEFDSFQKNQIEKILKNLDYNNYSFHKDQYNKFRFLIVRL